MVNQFCVWFSWEKLGLAIFQTYCPQTIQIKLIFPLGTISHSGNRSVDSGSLLVCNRDTLTSLPLLKPFPFYKSCVPIFIIKVCI